MNPADTLWPPFRGVSKPRGSQSRGPAGRAEAGSTRSSPWGSEAFGRFDVHHDHDWTWQPAAVMGYPTPWQVRRWSGGILAPVAGRMHSLAQPAVLRPGSCRSSRASAPLGICDCPLNLPWFRVWASHRTDASTAAVLLHHFGVPQLLSLCRSMRVVALYNTAVQWCGLEVKPPCVQSPSVLEWYMAGRLAVLPGAAFISTTGACSCAPTAWKPGRCTCIVSRVLELGCVSVRILGYPSTCLLQPSRSSMAMWTSWPCMGAWDSRQHVARQAASWSAWCGFW